MTPTTKATLLSAFVLPGLGQFILKRYYRAWTLVLTTLLAITIIIVSSVQKALAISEQIVRSGMIPDINTISRMVAESTAGMDPAIINTATFAIIAAWLVAIIDARFIKR